MLTNKTTCCALVALISVLAIGCDTTSPENFPKLDALTVAIFLESEERTVLPAGVDYRGINNQGIALTKTSEGFKDHLYNDAANYCTIAYGHLIKKAPCNGSEPSEFLNGISESTGEELLRQDLRIAERVVLTAVKVDLTDSQYAALCDFVFNVGGGNFRRSTLLKVINQNTFEQVPTQLRRWVMAGGRQLPGLVKRRDAEIDLFFDGLPVPRAVLAPGADMSPIDIRQGET